MRAASLGWHDVQDAEEKRRLRKALGISLGVHLGLVLLLIFMPPLSIVPPPAAITVELIAGPPIAPPAAPKPKGSSGAKRAAPPPKTPEPAPPAEPPPPTPPKVKVAQVLPENEQQPHKKKVEEPPPKKTREVAKPDSKPAEKPVKKVVEKKPARPQSYDDVMKDLEDELGDDELDELLEAAPPRPGVRTAAESSGTATRNQAGVKLDPRLAGWMDEATRLIRSKWVTPSNFRGRGLVTYLELDLTEDGRLIGEPTVLRSSGDPYFDDTAVAALISVGELPPPPRAGRLSFEFSSDEE